MRRTVIYLFELSNSLRYVLSPDPFLAIYVWLKLARVSMKSG